MDKLYWVWLTVTMKFAAVSINRVLYKFTPREAYNADEGELLSSGLDKRTVEKLCDKNLDRANAIVEKCDKKNIRIITSNAPEYPRALDRLPDKPNVIYVRGDINCIKGKRTACFIGTRKMTYRGERFGIDYAHKLISEGKVLVSGIADGIDSIAAHVSLEESVPTVAVLGVDIDRYYPASNERLIDRVASSGAVISEYPPDTNARYFANRNRIIVGLSDTVNVIEAPEKSGSLIGARLALSMKIPTFACNFEGESFEGCRQLISEGAGRLELDGTAVAGKVTEKKTEKKVEKKAEKKTTRSPRAVAEPTEKTAVKREVPKEFKGLHRFIYEKLLEGEQRESVFFNTDNRVQDVIITLSEMEIMGYIEALPGGRYKLKN